MTEAPEGTHERVPGFRGWYVVAGAFVVLMVVFGSAYSFPALFDELYREWPGSRRDISLAFGVMGIVYFLVGAVAGPLADKVDPRWVIGTGVVLVGTGMIAGSLATELWHFILAYGLCMGIGIGFAYVPSVAPIQRWFFRRRGVASGIAIAGIGVGTFASPLIAAQIIGWGDWRTACLAIGIGGMGLGLAGTAMILRGPEAVGQWPDGVRGQSATPPTVSAGMTIGQAIRSRPFLIMYLGSFTVSFPIFVPFVHLVPSILDTGLYEKDTAVAVASLIGVGSLAGRFFIGPVSDRAGRRPTLIAQYLGMALLLLLWLATSNIVLLGFFSLAYGMCYGGFVALAPAVMIDYTGPRHASGILGLLYTSVGFGTFFGPVLVGAAFDALKDYTWPLIFSVGVAALAAAIIFLLPNPERWRADNGIS
jgi:MFS family permease